MKWSADIFKKYGSKVGLVLMRLFEIFVAVVLIMFLLLRYMYVHIGF